MCKHRACLYIYRYMAKLVNHFDSVVLDGTGQVHEPVNWLRYKPNSPLHPIDLLGIEDQLFLSGLSIDIRRSVHQLSIPQAAWFNAGSFFHAVDTCLWDKDKHLPMART